MSLLQCSHCAKNISATHKICPHCGETISFWREVKSTIEKSRLHQAAVVVFVLFLLGTSWYLGKSTGYRWPLFIMVLICAPVVPWLLQLAYKSAAPVEDVTKENDASIKSDSINAEDEQKIWRG